MSTLGGATKARAQKLSWLQAGVHKARLRSAGCSTWTLFCQTSQEGFYQRPQTDAYHEAHDSWSSLGPKSATLEPGGAVSYLIENVVRAPTRTSMRAVPISRPLQTEFLARTSNMLTNAPHTFVLKFMEGVCCLDFQVSNQAASRGDGSDSELV